MVLNDIIERIQSDAELSAETRNCLHAATAGHPWCKGKTLDERKIDVRLACVGRGVSYYLLDLVQKATE